MRYAVIAFALACAPACTIQLGPDVRRQLSEGFERQEEAIVLSTEHAAARSSRATAAAAANLAKQSEKTTEALRSAVEHMRRLNDVLAALSDEIRRRPCTAAEPMTIVPREERVIVR